jgi:phage terminase small subunit
MSEEKELTEKEQLFIAEYLVNGFNGTQAAIKAGYSKNTAGEIAHENLKKPHISNRVSSYLDEVLGKYRNTLHYEIIDTYRRRAFYNPADFIDCEGQLLKPLEDYGPDGVVIDGIEKQIKQVGKEVYDVVKVKLADRDKALSQLTAYMNLIKNTVDLSGELKAIIFQSKDQDVL